MKCLKCQKKSIISNYCKLHFIDYFETTVKNTIKKYKLFTKKDRIVVAVSGGKDSLTVLYILKKFGYDIEGLAIDEGIDDYRAHTLKDLKTFTKKYNIKFKINSFKKEFGVTLDEAVKKADENPCHLCGVLRRFLLNKYSKEYDVIATGHNLDDEAQAVMMNILKAQTWLMARLGVISGVKKTKYFTRRVKPLYFLKEKEVKAYTILQGFDIRFSECPHTHSSFRSQVQEMLNYYESKHHGAKLNLINNFLLKLPKIKSIYKTPKTITLCEKCGEPASKNECRTCQIISKLKTL